MTDINDTAPRDKNTPILELSGISKQFGGVPALDSVGLRLFSGEVHALMGQNGAGKSTLIKTVGGRKYFRWPLSTPRRVCGLVDRLGSHASRRNCVVGEA